MHDEMTRISLFQMNLVSQGIRSFQLHQRSATCYRALNHFFAFCRILLLFKIYKEVSNLIIKHLMTRYMCELKTELVTCTD